MLNLVKELWGLNRSLSGERVRQTLTVIAPLLPDLEIKSVSTGESVFDWQFPKEWKFE